MLSIAIGSWLLSRSRVTESPEQHAARLAKQLGIVVSFGDPSTFFVAPYTQAVPNSSMFDAKPADRDAAAIALRAVEQSVTLYPAGFARRLVRAIFICGELTMDGIPAGGNAGPAWIVLSAPRSLGEEGIHITSLLGVHHEMSSFVLKNDADTIRGWLAFSPPGWDYAASGSAGLVRGREPDPDLSTGFLSAYGGTSAENDFNTYAEKVFTEPESVIAAARKSPLVARKLRFVLNAYIKVDGRMRDVFVRLGLGAFVD